MKIGIYLEQYQSGGVDTHLVSLLRSWPDKQDTFTLFTNEDNEGLRYHGQTFATLLRQIEVFKSNSYVSAVNKIISWPLGKYWRYFLLPLLPVFFVHQYFQALSLLKENPVDFLISDNGAYPGAWGALAAILAAKKSGIKSLLVVHHNATPYQLFRKFFEKHVDSAIAKSTTIVTVSNATKNTLLLQRSALNTAEITFIHNGTDITAPGPSDQAMIDFREKYSSKKIVGVIGRVESYKGHEELLRGLALLPEKKRSELEIAFIGSSSAEEKSRLTDIAKSLNIEDKVHFLGFIPGDAKSIITQLDLLAVLTRDFEGFGLTLIEAMTVKVPTMSTNVGAIPEFITHRENGYLVPPQRPEKVAEGLSDFLDHSEQWRDRATYALKNINLFSEQVMAKKYCDLVRSISSR